MPAVHEGFIGFKVQANEKKRFCLRMFEVRQWT